MLQLSWQQRGACLQISDLHEPLLHGVSHALLPEHADAVPEESMLSGLAEVLYEADEALIARALFDLDTRSATSVPVFYALLPAVGGASAWLLARRCAHGHPPAPGAVEAGYCMKSLRHGPCALDQHLAASSGQRRLVCA